MLSKKVKSNVFNQIINTPNFLGKYTEHDGIITFLNKIWDLKSMPSEDGRFKNAYEDAVQHLINNDDWAMEYLFLERFNLIDGDENYFALFLETIVNPMVRIDKNDIFIFVKNINSLLELTGYKLILTSYFEELPVYKFRLRTDSDDLPIDILANNIPVYLNNFQGEKQYPHFSLSYIDWDDYHCKTLFNLTFVINSRNFNRIGRVKIMKRDNNLTLPTLVDNFFFLPNDYCSLGQEESYYLNLKQQLGNEHYTSFLLGLRDVATFPKINESFENDPIYKASLIRGNEIERLARTIRFKIEGVHQNEYYKFTFDHQPPYSENTIALNFDFEYNTDFEHRIYALIGKNGTGKTTILSTLAKKLSEKNPLNFTPRKPTYGKIFTVSYSFFDKFEIPNSDASFNYVYCGLKKNDSSWKSNEDLLTEFYQSVLLIKQKKIENDWYDILSNFIAKDILDIAFHEEEETFSTHNNYIFNETKFNEVNKYLSSGQSITLFMITEILSQIRFDSLILFDEPETHLHPNAISALLNTLFDLVKRFKSFCVIATHSPIVIQEIPARNIFVIERENNTAYVRSLERESFGENLTVITQDIFGNGDVPKHFISLIKELISKDKSYSEIIDIIESDNLPVTSNVRLYIKALMPK